MNSIGSQQQEGASRVIGSVEMLKDRQFTQGESFLFSALGEIQDFFEHLCQDSMHIVDSLSALQAEYFHAAEETVIQQIADLLEVERNKIPLQLVQNALQAIQDLQNDHH